MSLFEILQRATQRFRFVGADALDEVHQSSPPITNLGSLIERINHEPRNQFVATVDGRVLVSSVITNLDDEVLSRQPLEHRHHSGVGEVTLCTQRFVNLTDGLWRGGIPQMVHHRPFQIT